MNADGLCARRDQAADIVYDGSQPTNIFNGNWDTNKADKTYEQQFVVADQQYSRLLSILLAQLRGASRSTSRAQNS